LDVSNLTVRELQLEAARALSTMEATSNNIHKFNRAAHHDSHAWYRAVINWYVDEYGDLPSRHGPGKEVKLIMDQ
jgi:hypothetical protein